MKIYVVTQGRYSDYHIITATTNEEEAKKIAAKFDKDGWDKTYVEEYDDEQNVVYERPLWNVIFLTTGDVDTVKLAEFDFEYEEAKDGPVVKCLWNDRIQVYVSADTSEAAVKIAAEQRAMYLAQKEGLC